MNRSFISFFAFGLLNNILYVIILSAAVDLVGSSTPKAVVLLADILPSFTIKLVAPFFIHKIAYKTRIHSLVVLSCSGMVIISCFNSIPVRVFGILLALVSSGLGELTFLQLTHFYGVSSLSGFLSGTGGAGLAGSFLFMLMTNILGINVSLTLFISLALPCGFLLVYYYVLGEYDIEYDTIESDDVQFEDVQEDLDNNTFHRTIRRIKPLLIPYMLPLSTVYVSEYVINQGVSPTLLFPIDTLPKWLFRSYRDIYVVYGFLYQLGVFVSRSLISFVRIRQLHWLSLLQLFNLGLTIFQSVYDVPFLSIYPLLLLIFYEGLLGGALYVNTFVSVSEEVSKESREFSMGAVSISDSFGVVVAGCFNWWLEGKLCGMQVARGRDWCRSG